MVGVTRWLDEDEQRTWRSFLATSELLYAALDRQLQRDAGISLPCSKNMSLSSGA